MIDSPRLSTAHDGLIDAVGMAAGGIEAASLTSHWPVVGAAFGHGILAVGQAVYGWIPDWSPAQAQSASGRAAILADTKATLADRADPMDWIAGHRVEHSPFWQTVHGVADALDPRTSRPWYSRIAWANLYPVAPNDVKGNPTGLLRDVQTVPAAAVLDAVIEVLEPRLVLVLAGPFIWPLVGSLRLGLLDRQPAPLTLAGRRDGGSWLCGMHPGGAQRRGWPARAYAAHIVERVGDLDL